MPRSVWKGPFADALQLISKNLYQGTRRSTILPEWIGKKIRVHNGQRLIEVNVIEEMIGHKLGEFAPTRRLGIHKGVILRQRRESLRKKPKKR